MTWVIQTDALSKHFSPQIGFRRLIRREHASQVAVDGVDLRVRRGELFGLVGPNGAGKTTLIKMLCTLIQPTSGSARINNLSLSRDTEIKASIGLVTSDERSFYWRLTGRQNLEFFAHLHNIPNDEISSRVEEALQQVSLEEVADRPFMTYATGMRQRLSIARALLSRPRILFLDEPTKGLDPEATQRLHALLRDKLVDEQGITVFVTTHDMGEAESLCDRIAVMSHGRICACGSIDELRERVGKTDQASLRELYPELIKLTHNESAQATEEYPNSDPPIPARQRRPGYGFSPRLIAAFLKKDIINEISYPFALILQLLSIFFSVGVFYFISQMIGSAASPYLTQYDGDYFSFVLIGIAFASYFGVGLTSFSNNLRQAQTTGTLEAMLATPTRISAIILSSALWDYLLTTIKVLVYLAVGSLILHVDLGHSNYLAAILVLILSVISFSSIGILAASFIMVLKRGDPIAWFFNATSGLLGGVYYPLDVMPTWMQWLARWLPITYALEAMRKALLQGLPLKFLWTELIVLGIFCCVLFPSGLLCFRYAVRLAKIEGSLTHY